MYKLLYQSAIISNHVAGLNVSLSALKSSHLEQLNSEFFALLSTRFSILKIDYLLMRIGIISTFNFQDTHEPITLTLKTRSQVHNHNHNHIPNLTSDRNPYSSIPLSYAPSRVHCNASHSLPKHFVPIRNAKPKRDFPHSLLHPGRF